MQADRAKYSLIAGVRSASMDASIFIWKACRVKNTRISTICAQKSEKQVKKLSNRRSEIVSWIQFGDHLGSVNIDIWLLLITDM